MNTSSPSKTSSIFALLLLVPAPSFGVIMALWIMPGELGRIFWVLSKGWLLLLPLIWWLCVDKRRLSWSPMRQGGLWMGLLLGVVIGGGILAAYFLFGKATIDPEPVRELTAKNRLSEWSVYLLFVSYTILVNALLEEYVWRWFVFSKCEIIVSSAAALVLSAAFFTLHHVIALAAYFGIAVTVAGSVGVFGGGVIWSWCYRRYRSIWPGYLSHAIVDAAIFLIGAWLILD